MMKMITLTLITCFFCASLGAPPAPSTMIFESEGINPYEALWNATTIVESGKNAFAVGDKHLKEYSYGIVQIRKTRLDDFYRQTGIRYDVADMYDTLKSKQVFMHYCTGLNMEKISREWNGGNKGMKKKSTLKYWRKIQSKL